MVLGLYAALFVLRGGVGPYRGHIQDDARKGQRIDTQWLAAEDGGQELTALLFYPGDGSRESVFSLYRKDRMPLFGWHFRAGGGIAEIDGSVAELAVEGFQERACLSMNGPGICRVELGNGGSIALDPERPFALVLPGNAGTAVFYDRDGNQVESARYGM